MQPATHNGTCDNKLMIRQGRLEEQLLGTIEQGILNPSMLDKLIARQRAYRAIAEPGNEVKLIQEIIASYRPIKLDVAANEFREHVTRAIRDFRDTLSTGEDTRDAVRAK